MCQWAHAWRMSFNPDPIQQAVELIFSNPASTTRPYFEKI